MHTQGVLEVSKSSSPKGWKPCLFVLKKHTDAQRSTLDYYKDTKKRWQKQVSGGRRGGWDGREERGVGWEERGKLGGGLHRSTHH